MSEELKEKFDKLLDSYAQEAVLEVTDGTAQDSYSRELNRDDSTLYEFKKKAKDQLLQLFEEFAKELIGEDEKLGNDFNLAIANHISRGSGIQTKSSNPDKIAKNKLRAEQRKRLEAHKIS